MRARGCALPHRDGDLRWHPALKHPSGHVGPALVGLITDARDALLPPLNLHRTWITDDGSGRKAALDRPRLLLKNHRKAGGCVRLWPDDAVTYGLGLAEGIETALTLARVFTPVWSMIDAGNLGGAVAEVAVIPAISRVAALAGQIEVLKIADVFRPQRKALDLNVGVVTVQPGRQVDFRHVHAARIEIADIEHGEPAILALLANAALPPLVAGTHPAPGR